MIEEQEILSQIKLLPDNLKQEALHYIEFLKEKTFAENGAPRKKRCAGSAAGKYILAPDFDQPLEDFEDYM